MGAQDAVGYCLEAGTGERLAFAGAKFLVKASAGPEDDARASEKYGITWLT